MESPASDRVQIRLRSDTHELDAAIALSHESEALAPCATHSELSRHALRVIRYAFEHGRHCILRRGREQQPFVLQALPGAGVVTKDLHLDAADREHLEFLRGNSGQAKQSRSAIVRACLDTYANLVRRLVGGFALIEIADNGSERPVDVRAIATRAGEAPAAEPARAQLSLTLAPEDKSVDGERDEVPRHRGSSFSHVPTHLPSHRPIAKMEMLGIIFLCHSFGIWMAQRSAEIITVILTEDRSLWKRWRSRGDGLDKRYALNSLFKEFWASQTDESLREKVKGCLLLPDSWSSLDEAKSGGDEVQGLRGIRAQLELPKMAMERYLEVRVAQSLSQSSSWRNWSRSRQLRGGSREITAPVDWTAVLYHRLANSHVGSAPMVSHDLQQLLVDAFGVRTQRDLDSLAEACSWFNEKFHEAPTPRFSRRPGGGGDQLVSLQALLDALEASSSEPDKDRRRNWARFYYLFLEIAGVVLPVRHWPPPAEDIRKDKDAAEKAVARWQDPAAYASIESGVRVLSRADFSELRALIFGAQTAVGGLRTIFHGGIVPRVKHGRTWLVHGSPGDGKSTFGLHLAADMARRGRVAIIVCSEERLEVIEERLDVFNLRDSARYRVIRREQFEAMIKNPDEQGLDEEEGGLLVLFAGKHREHSAFAEGTNATGGGSRGAENSDQTMPLLKWLRETSDKVRAIYEAPNATEHQRRQRQKRWRWVSLVVDSIDDLQPDSAGTEQGRESQSHREMLVALVQGIEASRFWGVLLCGEHNPYKDQLANLADTVVELRTDERTGMQRNLRIRKCRMQPYDPGPHLFEMIEGVGCVVYPNLASIQRAVRRRIRPQLDDTNVIPVPAFICWPDEILNAPPSEWELPRPPDEMMEVTPPLGLEPALPWIRRKGAILAYGPPLCGKTPFLFNLVSERMKLPPYADWRLGATGGILLVSFHGTEQDVLRPVRESRRLRQKWAFNLSDVQHIWYGADETLRAARVANDLVERIQHSRRDRVPLEWIVFLGVEALKNNLPAVAAEGSFWPTIFAITASESITTAFMVVDDEGKSEFVSNYRQEMDYVLQFSRSGGNCLIHTKKSPDPPTLVGAAAASEYYPALSFPVGGGDLRLVAGQARAAATEDDRRKPPV